MICYNIPMKKFMTSKMDAETLEDFNDQECKILGDNEAFLTYYHQSDKVIWVNFLWANHKRKMLKICKQLWAISKVTDSIILFNCKEFEQMFQGHAEQIYVWTKEL